MSILIVTSVCLFFIVWGSFFQRQSSPQAATFRDELVQNMNERGLGSTWSSIYVINMASRTDRREHMELVAQALQLNFTYVEAVLKDSPAVDFIMERLWEESVLQDRIRNGETSAIRESEHPKLYGEQTWREHVLSSFDKPNTVFPLNGTYENIYFDFPAWPPQAPLACYLSHLKTWNLALQNDDDSVLILEDDIDAEFSLVNRWQEMTRSLADTEDGWDIVYLGWILGEERVHKPTFHPGLRKSNRPMGTHAYSLSRKGLRRLNGHVHNLPDLFTSPIDHDLPTKYIRINDSMGALQSYSATPPIIIPFVALGSDIGGDASERWGGILADSTVERIRAFQGHPVPKKDPKLIWEMWSTEDM
ncbi:Glycosyl transferase, family 25 [Phaffia rhodozyma]|uniref:Glycosyl transferase, family 25 n=1 Tax=Phaffia rhodozyma TaxID=264483 RepID=A0A0F7SX31_PHARH|nr:Glycosyl transferase, family 25 [Phaffia rhodozyma]